MVFHGPQQEKQVFIRRRSISDRAIQTGGGRKTGAENKSASYRPQRRKSWRRSTACSLYVLLLRYWRRLSGVPIDIGISCGERNPDPAISWGGGSGEANGSRRQTACKPGSVAGRSPRDGHSSGTPVTGRLTRPTRAAGPETDPSAVLRPPHAAPTWSCSRRGLPCRSRRRARGALLPHPFTLARRPCGPGRAVCSLWHFPWGRPRRALPGSVLPWSPDFPPPRA